MPKREWAKGFRGRVWVRHSVVPGSDPPREDVTFYISYRAPGDRRNRDEKIGKKSAKWTARKADNVLTSRLEGRTLPKAEVRRQEAEAEKNKPVTFGEYTKRWLGGHVARNLKTSTARGYRDLLDAYILPALEDRPLSEVTREDVKTLSFACLAEGRKRPKKMEDGTEDATLSARTVGYIIRTISAIYNHAIEDGIVQNNPALRPGRFIRTGPRREKVSTLTPAEGNLVLQTAEKHYKRIFPLLMTAMRTGMRQGELVALEWSDIDWNSNFIEVKRSVWRGVTGTTKSGKTRRVDMNDRLREVLLQHRNRMKMEALKAGIPVPALVFTSDEMTPYDSANIRKTFERTLTKAGIRRIRFHDLRHSYASWLVGNGESLAYVRDQLGHHSIAITVDLYSHLIPGANRQAVQRLDPETARAVESET